MSEPISVYFVCGGKYHDIDFVRLELLKLFSEDQRFRVRMADDYSKMDEITASDILVTYTVDVVPTEEQTAQLERWLEAGHKWFALHATNSILEFTDKGVDCPRRAPKFMHMLGSQFIGHPPIDYYPVTIEPGKESHPLVAGIDPMLVEDELYVSEFYDDVDVLLTTRWGGECEGFVESTIEEREHPIMYLRKYGEGEVLFLTLGHARSKYDLRPMVEVYPKMERGAWTVPDFYELLRRGLKWSTGELAA
ncbi:MAG: ThuA domain-containing protein [Pseudomonadota bacterium]